MLLTWSSPGGTSGEPDPRMPSGRFAGDGGLPSEDEDVGESGTAVVVGSSLETRLAALTDNAASCNDRIRSAMLPPDSFCTPFSGGGELIPLSLEGTCKQIEAGDGSRPTA